MRKILLLGIAFLLLSATANGKIRPGLKIGGNLNFPKWEPVPLGELSSGMSFNLGTELDLDFSKNFGIEVDLLYNNHRSNWDYSEFDPYYGVVVDFDVVTTLDSISIPVLAKAKFPSRQMVPFLGIGPEMGLILSHKSKIKVSANGLSAETTVDLGDETAEMNFAITFCGGVDINLRKVILSPELRFSLGLIDLDETDIGTMKNSQLIFLFGVKF